MLYDSGYEDQEMESMMSPGDPMCQLVMIGGWNKEKAVVTCPASRSQTTFVAFFNCRGCDSAKREILMAHNLPGC
jgi:hypothetical protein